MEFYDVTKEDVNEEIKKNLQDGKSYSLTFDEYTGNNKWFMCLNVHGSWGRKGIFCDRAVPDKTKKQIK